MPLLDRHAAEDLLYHEATLLDERRFDEWLALFTDDCRYWIPCGPKGSPGPITHLVSDNRIALEDRLWQLQHPRRHAQNPPSNTLHLVANVQAAGGDEPRINSSLLVHEVRATQGGGGDRRTFAGSCEHHVRWESEQWRIASKTIWLIDRDLPIYNLTFML